MKTRYLTLNDLENFMDDIVKACRDNPQITDYQGYLKLDNEVEIIQACINYIEAKDSLVEGIFDNKEEYLFGFIVYDNIRLTDDGNSAELHLCTSKDIWGTDFITIYKGILSYTLFDVLYALVPAKCRTTIAFMKKLGFKKTGYIPKSIPYVTAKNEVKMFDQLIYVWEKNAKIST